MRLMNSSLFKRLSKFARDGEGGATVEFVIWIPFFMGLILMITDVSMLFTRQSNFWNVSRDTARIVARHGMDGAAAAEYAQAHAAFGEFLPEISVEITSTEVTIAISALTAQVAPFGFFSFSDNARISARVTQALEPL
ncbi:MAG: pilus assembly protein [Paracoccaceae bacterium]|nr:pilus assembly protein [Paracoccaceae bacterium]